FELIKDKVPLTSVLEEDLNLKKSGRVLKANCPFHDERTPSFTAYPQSQSFHCFGCKASGTVIDYIMYRDEIKESYAAVEKIAGMYNINLPGFDKEEFESKRKTIKTNRSSAYEGFKKRKLANDYLIERGLNKETTYEFGIGFDEKRN